MASDNSTKLNCADAPSSTVYEVIDWCRDRAESERDKGDRFERAVRFYLKNDPLWAARLEDVWLWKNAPVNDGPDIGIDLVAKDAEDGTWWAIQCKCYDEGATLDYKTVSTFYGVMGDNNTYGHNMLVSTTENLSAHLDKVAREWGTVRLFPSHLSASPIDWDALVESRPPARRTYKEPREHQRLAIADCIAGFAKHDRGQLVMACGTGKTLTSLRLAEQMLAPGALVLFLAPSIALVSQTMREWANQCKRPLRCAVVCSDASASDAGGDTWETSLADVPYPATTDAGELFAQASSFDRTDGLNVVFSTYQSIQVVSDAQKAGLAPFDLVVCDEAHRTAGTASAAAPADEASEFVKVHDDHVVRAKKRLYMTATPKIYGDKARRVAKAESFEVSSMDDEEVYGPLFHQLSFGVAIDEGLLADYKPLALRVSEQAASEVYQMAMAGEEGFNVTDAAKVIGAWKGLAHQGRPGIGHPLKNAVAFCSTIEESMRMAEYFERTVNAYMEYERAQGNAVPNLVCRADHVDGSMPMSVRKAKLRWLANDEWDGSECHVLFNVRCLAEGVDVPSLDAVMFMQPKRSRIEVVQAVGRVMRRYRDKTYGYIVLPVVVPLGMDADEALDASEEYHVVWDTVQALRSHDERVEGAINALGYDLAATSVVEVIDVTTDGKERLADEPGKTKGGEKIESGGESEEGTQPCEQLQMSDADRRLQEAVNAIIVKKCGTRVYWEDWAADIGEIAKRHMARTSELTGPEGPARESFEAFVGGLRDSLNEGITEQEAVEMIAQHMITLPIFEALFGGAEFAGSNPVSIAMEQMVAALRAYGVQDDSDVRELDELYRSVRLRAAGVRTDAGRQRIVKELYEKFFKLAFPKTSDSLGIVYTPNEVVDYILHATDRLLEREFGLRLADAGVNVLDPFTGTGTFIVNLLQDEELMPADRLLAKYKGEIWCNEINLLAYYIATVNIEHAYHSRASCAPSDGASAPCAGFGSCQSQLGPAAGQTRSPEDPQAMREGVDAAGASAPCAGFGSCQSQLGPAAGQMHSPERPQEARESADSAEAGYVPFPGAVLTDTFQMYEAGDPIDVETFVDNTERVLREMEAPINVIVGNPPYSVGQRSANDNNQNMEYPTLDAKIADTYAAGTDATNKNSLYDSYIRAFRWASDRIGSRGIVSFVTNGGWLDASAMDGFRRCLTEEFSSIYVFNLWGNARTQGEQRRKEKDNVFGQGTRTPVCITMLVKNPDSAERGVVRYHDIGDCLTREDKLSIVRGAVDGEPWEWDVIVPDRHGDWLNQRDDSWYDFAPLGIAKFKEPSGVFKTWSCGLKT